MGKPKRLWDDIHVPETVLWAEQFTCTIWLPLDECVARLQDLRTRRDWLSPSYEVNAVYDERLLTASIRKMNKSGTVWGALRIASIDKESAKFELTASVGQDILFMLIMFVVMAIFLSPIIFSGSPAGILFVLLILTGFAAAVLYGVAWLKQKLIDDVKKALDIPTVWDELRQDLSDTK